MTTELPKTFDPAAIEARWYAHWESSGQFRPERPGAEPWTIVNPPPNVTGSLHIGHALDNTLQDILVRHARLQGKDARWVVGTDHAGIATQMVVERQLNEKQDKRTNYSREEFVAKVWDWKAESGGEITRQLRRLGCSMDWANERFTMDEGFSKAVLKVFVDLYNQQLLYRDKRLVNWDPGLGTAISDLEVETREVQGKFWHLSYPLADGSGAISVATTRPETMLADMAVAVNPEDARYTALIGQKVKLPITGRLIPIVADDHADPELGSGAVKITPGHDFNDFEVGKRAGFKPGEMLNMLDAQARVAQTADGLIPQDLLGLDRFEARKRVVALLEERGHLERVEDRVIATPFGDRSGDVIEPWLTDQWYVDAAELAKRPIAAVRSGAIKVVPKTWEKTFFNWMENIQPWCVSRQLWWGHRIPAWFGFDVQSSGSLAIHIPEDGELRDSGTALDKTFVAFDERAAIEASKAAYGDRQVVVVADRAAAVAYLMDNADSVKTHAPIWQDPDVLDTWFSSALWPFATLGWPEDADPKLNGRYPNDVLISGFDILFFWDARMMMQGMHFMGEVPFKTLYLHGLVRAADGQKMSKSKGNTVDPLGLIDRYGADALRFFMAAMESQGRDIKMDEKRVEGYRNFATKLWNAARFLQMNGVRGCASYGVPEAKLAFNRWIIAETSKTVRAVNRAYAKLRFDLIASELYHFTWHTFCDWYIELIKFTLQGNSDNEDISHDYRETIETRSVAGWAFDQILVMLHPLMPFITEEVWHAMGQRHHDLIVADWPVDKTRDSSASNADVRWLIRFTEQIRAVRSQLNVAPSAITKLRVESNQARIWKRLDKYAGTLGRVAKIDRFVERITLNVGAHGGAVEIETGSASGSDATVLAGSAQFFVDDVRYVLPLAGLIDLAAERDRLTKAIDAAVKDRDALAGRLNNASFVERAKPEAVEKARADHAERAAEAERLTAALARLG